MVQDQHGGRVFQGREKLPLHGLDKLSPSQAVLALEVQKAPVAAQGADNIKTPDMRLRRQAQGWPGWLPAVDEGGLQAEAALASVAG